MWRDLLQAGEGLRRDVVVGGFSCGDQTKARRTVPACDGTGLSVISE